ncbi:MAG: hypothetical protein KBB83_07020, partial [Alphaproteobacteria bacterium]|nr:hypothetical protein [Alphaproteobacteria bacterium]
MNDKILRLEERISELNNARQEPIAIIGMGCRFPGGANSPEEFWQLLSQGYSAVTEIPQDRWNIKQFYSEDANVPGKMYTKQGAFLDNIDMFEPEFFSITPREAERMDPQQRLFLEVAWQAIESAGQLTENLSESRTGVYLGVSSHDFVTYYMNKGMQGIDAYYGTGTQFSLAVGRLSYWLGLQGPSMVIDTACSSSLVALHVACQSLRNRETDMAIADGVHLMVTPELTIYCSKANMISRDGKCKTFDESADGYGRGEGCGAVVIKRLTDAQRDGDKVLAVIRGSVVNQDGKSAGITAPNRISQEKLLREGLSKYSIEPAKVSYLECHGTGTILGDPIELTALQTVFESSHDANNPLHLGSVKTNISHLEAAAGIAGVIKVVQSLRHKKIPPHVNFKKLNPHISLREDSFNINTKLVDWNSKTGPRIAGVSSFGFSGTNAFALLEEAPDIKRKPITNESHPDMQVLLMSAKSAEALTEYAKIYSDYLNSTDEDFLDICYTASNARNSFTHRLAVIAGSKQECYQKLTNYLAQGQATDITTSIVKRADKFKIVFDLPEKINLDQQYITAYFEDLYDKDLSFRVIFDQLDPLIQQRTGSSLRHLLDGGSTHLRQNNNDGLLTFMVEY